MQFKKSEWESRVDVPELKAGMERVIRSGGYFILEDAVDRDPLSRLQAASGKILDDYTRAKESNRGVNCFDANFYLDGDFTNEELVVNPLIMPFTLKTLDRFR